MKLSSIRQHQKVASIKYRKFKTTDRETITELMKELYRETTSKRNGIPSENINKTFSELLRSAEKGIMVVLEKWKQIVGYCLLINYWSNEYGGNVLSIDEVYIKPQFRGERIGTNFIESLIKSKFMKATALKLEVKPSNSKVIKVYKKIGFKPSKNSHLIYHYKKPQ